MRGLECVRRSGITADKANDANLPRARHFADKARVLSRVLDQYPTANPILHKLASALLFRKRFTAQPLRDLGGMQIKG